MLSRYLATSIITNDSALTAAFINGKTNVIADSLSRDWHIPDNVLISILNNLTTPSQMTPKLKNYKAPKELLSLIKSLEDSKITQEHLQHKHKPSRIGTLFSGPNTWKNLGSRTLSCPISKAKADSVYCAHLRELSEELKSLQDTSLSSVLAQSAVQSAVFARDSDLTCAQTPP